MTTTKRTAREEVLAAAEEHGWTRTYDETCALNVRMTKVGRRYDEIEFSTRRGEISYASINGRRIAGPDSLATVLAELIR